MNQMHNPDNQAELLAGVLDSSLDGIYAFKSERDESGRIVDFIFVVVNRAAEKLVGRTAEQLLGKRMLEMLPGNKTDGLFDAYIKVVETGEPFVAEHYYEHDGLANWYSISATRYGDGFTVSFSDITARKRSEEHFRVLFEASTDAHLLFDDTGIIDCNQAAADMLGYDDKQEMMHLQPAEMSPEFQPDGMRSMSKCIEMDQTARVEGFHRFDWMHRRKDGSDILVEVTLNPVKLSGKDALLVVWHDLTERVEAERAVREAVDSLNEAQQMANIGNWQWTVDEDIVFWSDQTKRMFGVPIDQPPPEFETHLKQIHPDDQAHWLAVVEQANQDRKPYSMRYRTVLPSGEVRLIEGHGQSEVGPDGRVIRMFGTVQDITEAETTRDQLEKLSLVASRTDNSVVLLDANGQINWVNRAFTTLTGYPQQEVLGKRPPELFQGPETNPNTIRRIKDNLKQGRAFNETLVKYRKDGSTYWSEIEVQPIRNDRDQITNFMAIERDVTERISHQQELEAQQHRLEFALQASRTGLWDWDITSGDNYLSDTWYTMLGYEPGELPMSVDSWHEITHPEDMQRAQDALADYFAGKSDRYACEIRVRNKAGDWQWVLDVGEAIERDDTDKVSRMIGLHVDIHEQKTAQIELEEQRHRLEFALQASRTGLWDWGVASGETYFSDTWYTMLGYEPGELPMNVQSWMDLTKPSDLEKAKAALEDYFAGKTDRYTCEQRVKNKAGDWHWILDVGEAVERDEQGNVTRMVGLHVDINEQKTAQVELEDQRHQLEFALQASRTGLWDWFVKDGRVFYSDTWYTMLGYEPGELPMDFASWEALAHPEDLPRATQAIEAYLTGKSPRYTCEMRMRNKAGQWQWINTIGEAAERDADGSIIRIVGLHLDIHEQKTAQDELEQARDEAQQISAAKSAFVANMSHEIRTPMNAILGFADLLLDGSQTTADKRNHAQTIRRSGKHLMGILNDILDLSKIEAGKLSVESIDCDPSELFESAISLMAPKANKRGIDLTFKANTDLPAQIMTDPTRVRQVLINLIGNAIKFTHEGEVGLAVTFEPGSDGQTLLRCDVTDTGIGISKDELVQLFKPFSQADESTTRKFGGTGLGLAISSNLCEMLGGELSCTSTPGVGSTFTATFRVQTTEAASARQKTPADASSAPANALRDTRILIVEDSTDNQRLFQHYVTKAGATIELAENGEEGRDAALSAEKAGFPFDIVLMDMQMPVLDGYNATGQLREMGYDRPIIALTAHASVDDRDKCLAAGCTDYLSKPVDRQQLIQMIAGHLGNAHVQSISA